jgi:hypothetical protein
MTKKEWLRHAESIGIKFMEADTRKAHINSCDICKARAKTQRKNRLARERHEAYTSAGLKRVRGALGGVYYE